MDVTAILARAPRCPQCQKILDVHQLVGAGDVAVPREKDFTVCSGCLSVLVFDASGNLRPLTVDEFVNLDGSTRANLERIQTRVLRAWQGERDADAY